jgi:cell division septation protein DedD
MRPALCGLAAGFLSLLPGVVTAQQGSVQIFSAAQGVTGNDERTGGLNEIQPEFGVSWLQPGSRFGTFQIETRGSRRADRLHVGRTYAVLRDLRYRGLSWTVEAGDTYFTRTLSDYAFTNLTAPAVTFNGGSITGRASRGTIQIVGGRATAWRNIFGSDPDTLAQWISVVRGSFQLSERVALLGRVSRVRTSGLSEFTFSIADSRQAAGGIRFTLTPSVDLIGDASFVQYRRRDSNVQERDGSGLLGANVHLPRGWFQVNVSRLSPGDSPLMNDPLHDRETLFAAGEYDLGPRGRVFGGWEGFRTNLEPEGTSSELPQNISSRGFGGVRVQIADRSTVSFRVEDGAAIARPVRGGLDSESNTGAVTADWQGTFGQVMTYARAARRENVQRRSLGASFTQQELAGQLFLRFSPGTQLFTVASITRHETGEAAGSTYWQVGGGAQLQLESNLWVRGEATASRNVDLRTREFVPRESFDAGLSGRLKGRVTFSVSFAADRTPLLFGTGTPWTTRTLVRFTQSFSTGAARIPTRATPFGKVVSRPRGSGTVLGTVFTDWNANGIRDPGEEPLENIPVRVDASAVTTRRDGEFSFLNVPAGPQTVGLDTMAIPVDFDPPAESAVNIELDPGITRRVTFGLIPLGAVRGRVIVDANRNGRADPGEEPLEGAVLVLDAGARSEQVRKGVYRFDSIRSGDHVVSLLRESLPEGAVITGATEVPLALNRDQLNVEIDFAVAIEKRPELRRVFPPRGGSPQKPGTGPAAAGDPATRPATAAMTTPPPVPPTRPASPASRAAPAAAVSRSPRTGRAVAGAGVKEVFAVQVAALLDPVRARDIVSQLTAVGYPAYLVEPAADAPDGPYRVRIGGYPTRAAAASAVAPLERARGEKLWVIRAPAVD